MSVTVSDIMKLPSLRGARVLAGESGLSRIVSSISVLEYADPDILQDELFNNNEFFGSEIVITGFMNIPNDVERQCANLRRLAEVGEVGLILYYVGVFMKRVDTRLTDLANELGFALICMPEKRMDMRYSEVICEVMEAIYKDQIGDTNLVGELLERTSRLPSHQRTVDTVLKMLSDRIHASVFLIDGGRLDGPRRILNEATWPRALRASLLKELPSLALPGYGESRACASPVRGRLYRSAIRAQDGRGIDMLLLKEGEPLEAIPLRQAVEAVQLAVNIWSGTEPQSGSRDRVVVGELVRAILQDEPIKMRRLADIFRVDVASMNAMWVINALPDEAALPSNGARLGDTLGTARPHAAAYAASGITGAMDALVDAARSCAEIYSETAVADVYEGALVLFMTSPASVRDADELTAELFALLSRHDIRATLTRCCSLNDTARVREAFLDNSRGLNAARRIFPGRTAFSLERVRFALTCGERVESGEKAVGDALRCLTPLTGEREEPSLRATLRCFLLDADCNVAATAARMFVHKNTIKYRMQRISNLLGFQIGALPDTVPLYTACAVERLLA